MERLNHDPSLDRCPRYQDPPYALHRAALIQSQAVANVTTEEEAVAFLTQTWREANVAEQEVWRNQQAADEAAEAAAAAEAEQNAAAQRAEERRREEAERKTLEKGKVKLHPIRRVPAPEHITARPAQYAINKLKNHEHVFLWYFLLSSCKLTASTSAAVQDNTYSIADNGSGNIVFKQSAQGTPSKDAVEDINLSWADIVAAKMRLLTWMAKTGWPEEHIEMFSAFFTGMEVHEGHEAPMGTEAMVRYHAILRREWHDCNEAGAPFDLAVFSEVLYRQCKQDVQDEAQALRAARSVS